MKYLKPLQSAKLIRRYKRFLADISLPNGQEITIHCPNTGSMLGCAKPNAQIWYSQSDNSARKYPATWELSEIDGHLIGINTHRANQLVLEGIENGTIAELTGFTHIRREVVFGQERSRIDLLLASSANADRCNVNATDCYVEVKSVTLATSEGVGYFPDAITTRGQKHLRELMAVCADGQRGVLCFCVQHTGVTVVKPAAHIDADYADLLRKAHSQGVELLAYSANICPNEITLAKKIPVLLD